MNTTAHPPRRFLKLGIPLVVLAIGLPTAALAAWPHLAPAKQGEHAGYTGDGTFTDHGPKRAANRFALDLGAVDLTKSGRHEFTLTGLPAVKFNTGLALDLLHPFNDPALPADAKPGWFSKVTVKMTLTETKTGKTVFDFNRPLNEYTWTNVGPQPNWSLLYNRGDFRDETGKSMFNPKADTSYTLVVEVTSKTDAAVPALLLVEGGSRKED